MVIGKIKRIGGNMVLDWISRLYSMLFKNGVVPESWRSTMIGPGRGCIDKMFILKQINEKIQEKKIGYM